MDRFENIEAEDEHADVVRGAKGSGGKSGGGASVAKDTLFTSATIKIVDLLCEGEISGLAGGMKGIYLNDTPVQNEDDSLNFKGISFEFRVGTPDQSYMEGYPSVETPVDVGTKVQFNVPVVATVSDPDCDRARVTLQIPALLIAKTDGSVRQNSVSYRIEARYSGGPWVNELGDQTITGKASSPFFPSHEIALPRNPVGSSPPWQVRVTRLSPDTDDFNESQDKFTVQSDTIYQSLTGIIDSKFAYPHSALVGITADASIFGSSLPTRQYLVSGVKVRVPSNYDPFTRVYTGIWNGTFKESWTDNPAWVLYALLENDRFGLGQLIDTDSIDKWSLYQIGAYCDQQVDNGYGGTEPRFAFNGVISDQVDAFELLELVATAFRGMTYWSSGTVTATQDRPADPVILATEANVIDGEFSYASSSRRARHTVAIVGWNDPTDLYKINYEVIEDSKGVARYGYNPTRIDLLGCTSRGQAHRAGLWALLTELQETQVVTYRAGLDHAVVRPGDIVAVQDPQIASVNLSGRLLAGTTTQVMKLDHPISFGSAAMTISVMMPDGRVAERSVVAQPAGTSTDTVTLSSALPSLPDPAAVYVLAVDIKAQLFRVVSIKEVEPHIYEVQGLQHEPGKYATVDDGAPFEDLPISLFPKTVLPPTNLTVRESLYHELGIPRQALTLSWTAGQPFNTVGYLVTAIKPNGAVINLPQRPTASADFTDVDAGEWFFSVTAVGITGAVSDPAEITYDVKGWAGETLPTIEDLRVKGDGPPNEFTGRSCTMTWKIVFPGGEDPYTLKCVAYVFDHESNDLLHREMLATGQTEWTYDYQVNVNEGGPRRRFRVGVSAISPTGVEGALTQLLVSNPPPAMVIPRVRGGGRILYVEYDRPADSDLAGGLIWVSETQGFNPLITIPTYDGPQNLVAIPVDGPGKYYVRLACYDDFSKDVDELNVSPEIEFIVVDTIFDNTSPPIPLNLVLTTQAVVADTGEVYAVVTATVDVIDPEETNIGTYEFSIRAGGLADTGNPFITSVSGSNTFEWRGLRPGRSYTVNVRATSRFGYKSGTTPDKTIVAAASNEPPAKITGLTSPGSSVKSVFLRFTRPPEPDIDRVEIFADAGPTYEDGTATQVGASKSNVFTHGGLTGGQVLTYRARAVNTSGLIGPLSDPVTVTVGQVGENDIAVNAVYAEAIQSGSINTAHLDVDNFELPAEILVQGTSVRIGGLSDPASIINAGGEATKINPGQILIAGDTTLADWRTGTDLTEIDGGKISAGTISADKVEIGSRGLTIVGLQFEVDVPTNVLSWTAGEIHWTDRSPSGDIISQKAVIAAGSFVFSGTVQYIGWEKGATTLKHAPVRYFGANDVNLGSWRGETDLIINYGRTIIDGSQIKTHSIMAEQLTTGQLISNEAQIAYGIIVNGHLHDVGFDKLTGGTLGIAEDLKIGGDDFKINAASQRLTVSSLGQRRLEIGQLSSDPADKGIKIYDPNGNIILSSTGGIGRAAIPPEAFMGGQSNNQLYNATFAQSTLGWSVFASAGVGVAPFLGRNFAGWNPKGGFAGYTNLPGTALPSGQIVDAYNTNRNGDRYPAEPGRRYEASVSLGAHRCQGQVVLVCYDLFNNIIASSAGALVTSATLGGSQLANYGFSGAFLIAPPNASSLAIIVRMHGTGESDPYVFMTRAYLGEAQLSQTQFSPWMPGMEQADIDAVAGAGSFSKISNINSANIANYFSSAAIQDAYIATLHGDKIIANSLDAEKIKVGSITSREISTTDILITGTAQIENAVIENATIKDGAVSQSLTNQNDFSSATININVRPNASVQVIAWHGGSRSAPHPGFTTDATVGEFILYLDGSPIHTLKNNRDIWQDSGGAYFHSVQTQTLCYMIKGLSEGSHAIRVQNTQGATKGTQGSAGIVLNVTELSK